MCCSVCLCIYMYMRISPYECVCVFVTLSRACHLCAAWLNLAVSLQAIAGSLHLCRSNESLTLSDEASSGRDAETEGEMERNKQKDERSQERKQDKTNKHTQTDWREFASLYLSIHVLPIQLGMELFHCARALGTVKHSMALGPSSI